MIVLEKLPDGSVIIIELKRHKTPRDVIAQAIDYASWVVDIDDSKLVDIYFNIAKTFIKRTKFG